MTIFPLIPKQADERATAFFTIQFKAIHTDEFAILEEYVKDEEEFNLSTLIDFGVAPEQKVVRVHVKFRFEKDEHPVLLSRVTTIPHPWSEAFPTLWSKAFPRYGH